MPTPPVVPITSTPSPSPTASIAQPEETSEGKVGLAYSRVSAIRSNSCSGENFASNLVKELFSKEECMRSNVKGMFGKLKFDEKRIGYIRHQTFELFPVRMTENEQKCWASCV